MLDLAFGITSAAVVLGAMLILAHQRGRPFARISSTALGITHGLIGAIGITALILAWFEGDLLGKSALDALILLGAALLGGLTIATLAWRRGRVPGALIATHAAIAAFGYLLLAGFILS